VTLQINGEEVRLIPVRKAHTDGDTLVQFSTHDALAVGDYFCTTGYPVVDLNNGGTLQGILPSPWQGRELIVLRKFYCIGSLLLHLFKGESAA
jgi:hypothetical protein